MSAASEHATWTHIPVRVPLTACIRWTACILLATGVLLTPAAHAQGAEGSAPPDADALIALTQDFFDALAAGDAERLSAIQLPGGHAYISGADGSTTVRPFSAMTAGIAAQKGRFLERMFDPEVRVSGAVGMVYTAYDFHIDGAFSHCGTDVFTYLKTDVGWRMAQATYSVETEGCPDRPAPQ